MALSMSMFEWRRKEDGNFPSKFQNMSELISKAKVEEKSTCTSILVDGFRGHQIVVRGVSSKGKRSVSPYSRLIIV